MTYQDEARAFITQYEGDRIEFQGEATKVKREAVRIMKGLLGARSGDAEHVVRQRKLNEGIRADEEEAARHHRTPPLVP